MTGIDFEKLQNHNEPGRTLHGTSFVEIMAKLPQIPASNSR
ncbi:hypothetical protein T11_4366 [Trichinella zimbabwensis]|uniref:Uncharacterized protein n=2 Tax=Trichinella TaxID=6333 RepID=A0A0V1LZS6_9BILA|nr:hypothetical protein T11_4366 [Trichinella zimbabwensis]KRZ64844.1 hypothetical protein T10_6053 [Trichinella papuae]KRZ65097.1 hypothetical protein T10_10216 [Trichinella papuae]